jgi:hypothetical protein
MFFDVVEQNLLGSFPYYGNCLQSNGLNGQTTSINSIEPLLGVISSSNMAIELWIQLKSSKKDINVVSFSETDTSICNSFQLVSTSKSEVIQFGKITSWFDIRYLFDV